jgi:glycosyltransferase involved in cell wall biosynthesis
MIHLSVVSPVYGCKSCLHELYQKLVQALQAITPHFEIIFVNDNSPDNAWGTIVELAEQDKRVKGINLSRNFGQHYAIHAGLEHATGEWVVVMDCDLQDQPEEIFKLYEKAKSGFDIVLAQRLVRKDTFFKRMFSKVFYSVLGYLTETKQDSSVANFGIYHKKVIAAILSMKDKIRYFPAMVRWVGFKLTAVEVNHQARLVGETSYNIGKLLRMALDIILAFSDKPLRLTVKFGFLISSLAFFTAIIQFVRYLHGDISVAGFASIIISVWFLGGIMILILGIIGLYIGKTFDRVKDRPVYIIQQTIGLTHE